MCANLTPSIVLEYLPFDMYKSGEIVIPLTPRVCKWWSNTPRKVQMVDVRPIAPDGSTYNSIFFLMSTQFSERLEMLICSAE